MRCIIVDESCYWVSLLYELFLVVLLTVWTLVPTASESRVTEQSRVAAVVVLRTIYYYCYLAVRTDMMQLVVITKEEEVRGERTEETNASTLVRVTSRVTISPKIHCEQTQM